MLTIEGVAVKYFALTSTLLIVPAGMEYLTLLATLRGGRVRPTVAMLFALAFLVQFLVGGLSGIWVASPALDAHANNSYVVVAHFHYTLLAGSIFGFFAGVYHWWPKVTGRLLGERLGTRASRAVRARDQPHVRAAVRARRGRDDAPDRRLPGRRGVERVEPAVHGRRLPGRPVGARVPGQRRGLAPARTGRSLGRSHARVVDRRHRRPAATSPPRRPSGPTRRCWTHETVDDHRLLGRRCSRCGRWFSCCSRRRRSRSCCSAGRRWRCSGSRCW